MSMPGGKNLRLNAEEMEYIKNYTISPLYQAIRDADNPPVDIGCGTWIRTMINGSKVRCTTIIRSRIVFPISAGASFMGDPAIN